MLSSRQRRALILRAGLFGHRPASWRAIARRLGVSGSRVVRLTRAGATRLTRAGTCIEAGGAALGTSVLAPGGRSAVTQRATAAHEANVKPTAKRDISDVRGAFAQSTGLHLGLADDGPGGAKTLLLVLIATVLVLLGTLELMRRDRSLPPVLPTRGLGRSRKPLLFLDAKDSARDYIHVLASRYEIVWVPDGDEPANERLPDLDGDARVLRLGRATTFVSPAWKLRRITQESRGLPAALAGDIESDHEAWALDRSEPTLLVKTHPEAGLSDEQVTELLDWAETLAHANGGRFRGPGGPYVL